MPSNAPFMERGSTFYGPTQAINTSDYKGVEFEGKEVEFDGPDGRKLRGAVMRNVSGGTLLPGTPVIHYAAYRFKRYDHSTTGSTEVAGVIDSKLPAAGIRNGDLCIVFQRGKEDVLFASGQSGSQGDIAIAYTSGLANVVGIASVSAPQLAYSLGRLAAAFTTLAANSLKAVDLDVR